MWIPIIDQDGTPCAKNFITGHLVKMDGELLDPVMQFTGLKDKNGKEIYEGDILNINGIFTAKTIIGIPFIKAIVEFDNGSFMANIRENEIDRNVYLWLVNHGDYNQAEVIGNIYENPELIFKYLSNNT